MLGADPGARRAPGASALGIVLQESAPELDLTVRECLRLYAGYYTGAARRRRDDRARRARGAARTSEASKLSGGQRRRLDVALALIGDPELIFLDEPTTGFDPAARRAAWEVVAGLRALGKTIVLTTHYMEEAERLADRIVVMAQRRDRRRRHARHARRPRPRRPRSSPSRLPRRRRRAACRGARRPTSAAA